jgi:small-conductance mechanosensitive channel
VTRDPAKEKKGLMRRQRIKSIFIVATLLLSSGAVLKADTPAPGSIPDSQQIIAFLNQSITWYRHLGEEARLVDEPADVLFLYNDRQTAEQALALSFDFAHAEAQLLEARNPTADQPQDEANSSRYQRLSQLASKADDQLNQKQQELADLQKKLATSRGNDRKVIQATIDETQSELQLAQMRHDTLKNMLQFVASGSGTNDKRPGHSALVAQINELEQSVPEIKQTTAAAKNANGDNGGAGNSNSSSSSSNSGNSGNANSNASLTPALNISAKKAEPAGLIGRTASILALRNKMKGLEDIQYMTDSLEKHSKSLVTPLGAQLTEIAQRAQALSSLPNQNDAATMSDRKNQIDALTLQFKQLSSATLPLAKQGILLDRYKANVGRWHDSVYAQFKKELIGLAIRVGVLAIFLLIAVVISSFWRRLTFRYVPDVRRRHQFLLLRRIVMFIVFAIIVAISFSTDLGSLTTFAGLLAAGLAVCLQSVILSAVGYFVLLGKYGVRVGDRIQISGVNGTVVDIDLMRISLMELGGDGITSEGSPTGRTVEFPNAIVFQPTSGFFKEIRGANLFWHEVTLVLKAGKNYQEVEKQMLAAVDKVFADYREKVEQQYRYMERALNISLDMPRPQSRLRVTQGGLEIVIRYPVERDNAAEIDDRITRALLDVADHDASSSTSEKPKVIPSSSNSSNETPESQPITKGAK